MESKIFNNKMCVFVNYVGKISYNQATTKGLVILKFHENSHFIRLWESSGYENLKNVEHFIYLVISALLANCGEKCGLII